MSRDKKKYKGNNKPNPKRNVSPPKESGLVQQETSGNDIRTTSEQQKQNELPIRNDDQTIIANRIARKQLWVNVGVAVITLGLFSYTVIQTSLTRKSVDAAVQSVELTRKQFEVQNQPLIVTVPEGNRINFMPDGQIIMTYNVLNTGSFPTRIVKDRPVLFTYITGATDGQVIDFFEKELLKSQEYDKDILVPNSPTLLISKSTFSDKSSELKIKNGTESVCFGGETIYQDRLTNKRYKLKFAFIIKVVNWPDELVSDGVIYETTEMD